MSDWTDSLQAPSKDPSLCRVAMCSERWTHVEVAHPLAADSHRCAEHATAEHAHPLNVSNVKPSFFRKVYESARADSAQIREATSDYDTSPSARGTLYYEWSDGVAHAGFAIRPDGELVYVFSTARGMGARLVAAAIDKGATHLDCFDGHLTRLYSSAGFQRVTSLPNWDATGPDVVYMAVPTVEGSFLAALAKAEQA